MEGLRMDFLLSTWEGLFSFYQGRKSIKRAWRVLCVAVGLRRVISLNPDASLQTPGSMSRMIADVITHSVIFQKLSSCGPNPKCGLARVKGPWGRSGTPRQPPHSTPKALRLLTVPRFST